MSDPRRRIIVDGVDAESMLRVPLLIRSVAASLQPPRVLIALVLVVLIGILGRGWDLARGPRLTANSLLGAPADTVGPAETVRLMAAVGRWASAPTGLEALRGADGEVDPRRGLEIIDRGYRRWASLDGRAAPPAAGEDGADEDGVNVDGAAEAPAELADGPTDPNGRSAAQWRTDRQDIATMIPRGEFAATSAAVSVAFGQMAHGLVTLRPSRMADGLSVLLVTIPASLAREAPLFLGVFAPLLFLGWAIAGGAIARIAACFAGGGHRISAAMGFDFARRAWVDLLLAPAVPVVVVVGLAVPAGLAGLLLHVPGLNIVGGILALVAIPLAVIGGAIGLAAFVTVPLAGPAIAVERCDAIDAAQRPIAYLMQRPFRTAITLLLCLVAVVGVHAIVLAIAAAGSSLAHVAASIAGPIDALPMQPAGGVFAAAASGPPIVGAAWHERVAAFLVGVGTSGMQAFGLAVVGSVWISTTTTGFMVLREQCDGQDLEDIWHPGTVPGTLSGIVPGPVPSSAERPRSDRRRRDPATDASLSEHRDLMIERSPVVDGPPAPDSPEAAGRSADAETPSAPASSDVPAAPASPGTPGSSEGSGSSGSAKPADDA
ncbi:MAG: hypothetical protein AB8G96_05145 [Phycisphaerales bacterium]